MENSRNAMDNLDSILSFDDTVLEQIEFDVSRLEGTFVLTNAKNHVDTHNSGIECGQRECRDDARCDNISDKKFKSQDSIRLDDTLTELSCFPASDKNLNDSSLERMLEMQNESLDLPVAKDNCHNVAQKSDKNFTEKSMLKEEDDTIFLQIDEYFPSKSQDVKKLEKPKRETLVHDDNLPHKKLCAINNNDTVNVKPKADLSFYDLPPVVQRLVQKVKGISKLYEWQDECLRLPAVANRKNLVYALPTSGGKTLVAELLMLREIMCYKKNAIFILPFVALVQEKVQSLAAFALELGFLIEEYAGPKGQYPPKKRRKKNSIYICTIEKALGLINSLIETNRFDEVGIIVVDELHLLGENGGRGATLEVLLTKTMYANDNIHIVGMSATIGNLNEIVQFLKADLYTQNFRPVEIKEYVKCENNIWLLDTREEDILTDVKKINYRYSHEADVLDPDRIGGLVMDVIPKDSCLIFCSTRKNCENVAILLTKILFRSLEEHKKNDKLTLLNALNMEEGLCPILKRTIPFGVAYHHSGLTAQERRLLEDAFRNGTLCVMCCTSTLAAGVNLPARRVILRSPYVGQEFLSLSRYKQMIGRAGRAGMGDVGESILICKTTELQQAKEMLTSKMDDSMSSLHQEKDRGINKLILSAIFLSLATSRSKLQKLLATTLLSIQKDRLNVNVRMLTDKTIGTLLKSGIIKVKDNLSFKSMKPNITIHVPSQSLNLNNTLKSPQSSTKKTVILTDETDLELRDLGRAAIKGGINLQNAYVLYEDLKTAQNHLILLDCLHLLYLVTPYELTDHVKPIGTVYYDEITNLTEIQMVTARLLGINEAIARKIRDGMTPKNVDARVLNRFYVTLILNELWNQRDVRVVAEKYQINRGVVQNFLNSVSTFAGSVVRFCQELNEFWAFREILNSFSKKLSYCCPAEYEMLMELPSVKIGRARQLYKAGYKTIQDVAKADPNELKERLRYLSNKSVMQITAAAKLLLLEKFEDLRDEAEDVLAGVNISQFILPM